MAKNKYKNVVVDTITIEDMLLMYVKGDKPNEEPYIKGFV